MALSRPHTRTEKKTSHLHRQFPVGENWHCAMSPEHSEAVPPKGTDNAVTHAYARGCQLLLTFGAVKNHQ
jgi:hypothetical protein